MNNTDGTWQVRRELDFHERLYQLCKIFDLTSSSLLLLLLSSHGTDTPLERKVEVHHRQLDQVLKKPNSKT